MRVAAIYDDDGQMIATGSLLSLIHIAIPAGEKKDEPLDMPELLANLCDCIEDYLKTGNVRPL